MADFLIPNAERIRQFSDHLRFGETVLDVGTGSGVLAKLAVKRRAREVTAIDINPAAVANARKWLADTPSVKIIQSDLFACVTGVFDTIIFAAPWSEGDIKTPLDYALYDCGVVDRFCREVSNYLAENGRVWLQYCDAFPNNHEKLMHSIVNNDLVIVDSWSYPT